MENGKYIIVVEWGHKVAILFHPLISHEIFLQCYTETNIISAGFFRIDDEDIETFGRSTSLDLSPKDEDGDFIANIIR